jgi:molecular chaperone GrpE
MSEPNTQPDDRPTSDPRAAGTDAAMDEALEEAAAHSVALDLEQLQQQLDESRERQLRLQADWENYRKRARRELDEERRYANQYLLRDLLPVLDNVLRAIAAAEKSPEKGGLLDGFKMVAQQLGNVLAQHECRKVDALHQPFDPHRHEAISQQPSADYPPNTVLLVVQDGYQLYDRVVRPAQVIVSTAPPAAGT